MYGLKMMCLLKKENRGRLEQLDHCLPLVPSASCQMK